MIYHINSAALTRLLRSALFRSTEADPPGIARDHGPDLEHLETNGASPNRRMAVSGVFGEAGQQVVKPVRPPPIASANR
jgi:hypothetical protein